MYHVKEVTTPVPGNLDMNIAEEDEFSPDKFRSTIERLYMTVVRKLRGWNFRGLHSASVRLLASSASASISLDCVHGANSVVQPCFAP